MAMLCVTFSCDNNSSEEPELTFEERLEGDWSLTQVEYTFEIPAGLVGPTAITIEGTASNVQGDFEIGYNPNTISWDYQFDVTITGIGPMNLSDLREGTWEWDEATNTVTFTFTDGSTTTMEVLSETTEEVVLKTIVSITIPNTATFDVDANLTLVKQ